MRTEIIYDMSYGLHVNFFMWKNTFFVRFFNESEKEKAKQNEVRSTESTIKDLAEYECL